MSSLPCHPVIYEINTWVWLDELSRKHGKALDLAYKAGQVLARADRTWLERLVTRRERPADFALALERRNDDIKVVVQSAEA